MARVPWTSRWSRQAIAFLLTLGLATMADAVSPPARLAPDDLTPRLAFSEAVFDAALFGATDVAVSPDDRFIYVVSRIDDSVTAFARHPVTGKLRFLEAWRDGVGGVDSLESAQGVAISPDGGHVYVAARNDHALTVFARDPDTGGLSLLEVHRDDEDGVDGIGGASSVVVSPDDKHVYVAGYWDSAVAIFGRDRASGELTFVGRLRDGFAGVDGIEFVRGIGLSPDGAHLYAVGYLDDAIAAFRRDPLTGWLTFLDVYKDAYIGIDGLDGPVGVTVSPDGGNVYVASADASAVAVFERDSATGLLDFMASHQDDVDGVDGLQWTSEVVVSPDGAHVYAIGDSTDNAVAYFQRSGLDGALSYLGLVPMPNEMQAPNGLAFSSDGRRLYAAAWVFGALIELDRDIDTGELSMAGWQLSGSGLEGAVGIAADGNGCVYVTGNDDDAIAILRLDGESGRLRYQNLRTNGVGGVVGLDGARTVAVSADGAHVYVGGHNDSAVAVFESSTGCNWLEFVTAYKDGDGGIDGLGGVQAVALSPDGRQLYAASVNDDGIGIFDRDPASGKLVHSGVVKDGVGGVDGLDGAYALAFAPDGDFLYAAGYFDDAVTVFARDPGDGMLNFVESHRDGVLGVDGLDGANSVAVSPDGLHVYVASRIDSAIAVFERDPTSGRLGFDSLVRDGVDGNDGLQGARAVAVSPDGRAVYVASQHEHAIGVFKRDSVDGRLTFVEAHRDDAQGIDGLATANGLALSPDGSRVYVAGYDDDALVSFQRLTVQVFIDGFEADVARTNGEG